LRRKTLIMVREKDEEKIKERGKSSKIKEMRRMIEETKRRRNQS
jgi:hypothetical protein